VMQIYTKNAYAKIKKYFFYCIFLLFMDYIFYCLLCTSYYDLLSNKHKSISEK
jgi:hypothetical protein